MIYDDLVTSYVEILTDIRRNNIGLCEAGCGERSAWNKLGMMTVMAPNYAGAEPEPSRCVCSRADGEGLSAKARCFAFTARAGTPA